MDYRFTIDKSAEMKVLRDELSLLKVDKYVGDWKECYNQSDGQRIPTDYVIYIGQSDVIKSKNLYKIGRTSCVIGREKTARIKILYICRLPMEDTITVETIIHNLLSHRKITLPHGIDGRNEYFYGEFDELQEAVDITISLWKINPDEYKYTKSKVGPKRKQHMKEIIEKILKDGNNINCEDIEIVMSEPPCISYDENDYIDKDYLDEEYFSYVEKYSYI